MSRDCQALISKDNLIYNIRQIRKIASNSKLVAIVKANSYGHNIDIIAPILASEIDLFAPSTVEEAAELYNITNLKPILVLQGFNDQAEFEYIAGNNLHTTIHNEKQLGLAINSPKRLNLWLKIDTGMNRLGIKPELVSDYIEQLKQHNLILMSHFACADEAAHQMNSQQMNKFSQIIDNYSYHASLANSAAIFNFHDSHYDYIRPGLALYGASPIKSKEASDLNLKPVLTFVAKIIAIKEVKEGDNIGYGATSTMRNNGRIAIISCGYGDGYPLSAPSGTPVLVGGKLCPIIGRISMDMLTIDVSAHANCNIGDKAILWGDGLPVERIANYASSRPWQLLTNISKRVSRILV